MTAYVYRGQIIAVHDGDTLRVDLDLQVGTTHHDAEVGFDLHVAAHRFRLREDVRLLGCNARELATPGGPEAGAHLAALLPAGTWVTVQTFRPDKFGQRWDAKITLQDGTDVAHRMISDGYAAAWDGLGPKPTPPWPVPGASTIDLRPKPIGQRNHGGRHGANLDRSDDTFGGPG